MRSIRALFFRLAAVFRRDRQERDLNAELEAHLQMHIDDNVRTGMSEGEARRQALLKLGGIEQTKERHRAQQGIPLLECIAQDLRYTARMMRKSPSFTAVAVLTIAIGVGANTAIFSVVDAALLQPVPIRDSSRVVVIWADNLSHGWNRVGPSGQDYFDWKERSKSFDEMFLFEHGSGTITGVGEPEQIKGMRVTTNFAEFLGFKPVLGRAFLPGEDQGTHNVAMLSYNYWQRAFGSDPNVIGRTFTLNSEVYTVVGVMPPSAWTWFPCDVVAPWSIERLKRADSNLGVFARLKTGVTLKQAQSEMNAVAEEIGRIRPNRMGWGTTVVPLKAVTVEYIRPALLILLAAVCLVLLIACANVANLLLGRAVARQKEIAIRVALGAGRMRLVGQFLTESIVLSLTGGAAGLLLAYWGASLLYRIIPNSIPVPEAAAQIALPKGHIDLTVLAFTLVVSMLAGVLFGLAPIAGTLKPGEADSLRDGGRTGSLVPSAPGPRAALVISETALAVILVIASGLMIKSFWLLLRVNPGFNPENVLTAQIKLPADAADSPYRQPARRTLAFKRYLEEVRQIPGVESAALTEIIPLSQDDMDFSAFVIDEQPAESAGVQSAANFRIVSPEYFTTMQIPLRAGRAFSSYDDLDHPRVVIVDEAAERRFFSGRNPIGEHIRIPDASGQPREIVGVVGSVLDDSLDKQAKPTIYISSLQTSPQTMSLVVRTSLEPASVVRAIKNAIWSVDRNQPVFNVRIMSDIVSNTVSAERASFVLLTIFASVALLLAAVGIYGVTSYSVSRRTHEIGVRVALGATRGNVLRLVLGEGILLAGAGVALGVVGALVLARLMSSLLYGVGPMDPVTFFGVASGLLLVAVIANYFPARRAAKVNPIVALRWE